MPSAFRDPKSLSEWIQLDYFRRPRSLRRWRGWLGWVTLIATAVLVLVVLLMPRGKMVLQAGPVSSAHALFNDRCGECHTDSFQTARRLVPVNAENVHAVPDEACQKCHDGSPHNDKQLAVPACASCHREHRGRSSLARVSDDHCTSCHADLKANTRAGAESAFLDVRAFPQRHPEFRLWRESIADPGQLRFNHQTHLKAEGVFGPDGKVEVLKCTDCHRQDVAGRYMQPIAYTTDCGRCHVLSVQLAGPFADERLQAAAAEFAKIPAPHKEPAVVRAALRERLLRFVQKNPVLAEPAKQDRILPRPRRLEAISERQWVWAKRQLRETEELLFSNEQLPHNEGQLFDAAAGCAYCHIQNGPRGALPRGPDDLPVYEPTQLPRRWLTHSRFKHDSHRMLDCGECHPAKDSSKTSDVLIPRVETCARCHHASTGVRSDCEECHDYHHREQGYEATKGRSIAEALGQRP